MKCTSWLGHKWSKWFKVLGNPPRKIDNTELLYHSIGFKRRCARCGLAEWSWTEGTYALQKPTAAILEAGKAQL